MILRDAVHGLVAFESEEDAIIARLLDTRELQRLRLGAVIKLLLVNFKLPAYHAIKGFIITLDINSIYLNKLAFVNFELKIDRMRIPIEGRIGHNIRKCKPGI